MGTNFYYRKRSGLFGSDVEELHIGKQSAGWQFTFRAYKGEDGKIAIESWKTWKEILTRSKAGKIFDEYGKEFTAQEFIHMVEATSTGKNHVDFASYETNTWNDPEGWSFSLTEFC
jgi:hypothetical protein